jgi:hypothetical protein
MTGDARPAMRLATLTPDRFADLYRFNAAVFPPRCSLEARFRFQVLENPLLADRDRPDVLLVLDDADAIVGQVTLTPVDFLLGGERRRGFIGADLFVREEYRTGKAGAALSLRLVRSYSPFFCVGISVAAEKVFAAVGIRPVGALEKLLWLRLPAGIAGLGRAALGAASAFARPAFPATVAASGLSFTRATAADAERVPDRPSADGALQFARSPAVLRWRLLSLPDVYALYLADTDPGCFFAVRASERRGLRMLALVDYRVDGPHDPRFGAIVAAAKRLAAATRLDGVAAMTSVPAHTAALRRAWFFPVGHPLPLLANLREPPPAIVVTMADADTDLRFDASGAVFG